MATKLGKEKFTIGGEYIKDRTTFPGAYEMYLYYDINENYFFFDGKDIENIFGFDTLHNRLFLDCKTKVSAINTVVSLFNEQSTVKKMLLVDIQVPEEYLYDFKLVNDMFKSRETTLKTSLSPHILKIISGGIRNTNGISMSYQKYIEIEYNNNGVKLYAPCDDDWNYKVKDFSKKFSREFIDWTPETEQFLVEFNDKISSIVNNVINFFNTENEIDMLKKMQFTTNVIENI